MLTARNLSSSPLRKGAERADKVSNRQPQEREPMALRLLLHVSVYSSLIVTLAACDPCDNRVFQELPGPNGQVKAVVFQRNCGVLGGTSTQISVLPTTSKRLIAGGNTFGADTDDGRAPSLPNGGPPVMVTWANDQELRVAYDSRVRVFQSEKHIGSVAVSYEARTASPRTQSAPSPLSPKTRKVLSSRTP